MPLRVNSIQIGDGAQLPLGSFNVLVGPNNCGKSQTLRDIRDYVTTGSVEKLVIAKGVDLNLPSEADSIKELSILPHASPDHQRMLGVSYDLQSRAEFNPAKTWLSDSYRADSRLDLLRNLGRFWVAHLDAESRFRLASPTDCYDVRSESPGNALQAFFAGGKPFLDDLRKAFKDAFGIDIALDWAAMRRWYLRVGRDFGDIPDDRSALDVLLRSASELVEQGDGYRSFAGVVLAMLTFADRLLLLDEPEAFLHPAQARVLGRWLANHSRSSSAQVVLATHNSDFLWGIVSENQDVRVIRLNRTADTTTYHVIPAETTRELVQSPLLSSQPVLDSLFQKGVAVCEGDPDRAVYQTVAHAHLAASGGEDILFIHANGKDAIKTPVSLLKASGTPVCAIVDIDVFNSQEVFGQLVNSLTSKAPSDELSRLREDVAEQVEALPEDRLLEGLTESVTNWQKAGHGDLRRAKKALEGIAQRATRWNTVKSEGVRAFDEPTRSRVENLINLCKDIGLFVVPKGELESWLSLGVSKGREWNRLALEELHSQRCPADLQEFVAAVLNWLLPSEETSRGQCTPTS
jgi:ABC-type cobalamin/Fe3+-siderophores transport system ATPase subunit